MPAPRTLISDLPEQTVPVDTDELVVQNGPTTKRMTVGRLSTQTTTALVAHTEAASGAHAASAISAAPNVAPMLGIDVQTQLAQAATAISTTTGTIGTNATNLTNHIADNAAAFAGIITTLDEHTALIDTNATDLTNHVGDLAAAHAASSVSVAPVSGITSTDVQAALAELANAIATVRSLTYILTGNEEP